MNKEKEYSLADEIDKIPLKSEHIGIHAINPFIEHNSSARSIMLSGHLSQTLSIEGDEQRVTTGINQEVGKYVKRIEADCDMRILSIIERFRQTMGEDGIKESPETTVIYMDVSTLEIGHFILKRYDKLHNYFGFKYNPTKDISKIAINNVIEKGTVFMNPASVKDDSYNMGLDLNVAFMSHPSVSEDGVMISKSAIKRSKFNIYETRIVTFGEEGYMLNAYGDEDNYKSFPDIGERIRHDGLLLATREHDDDLSPVLLSPKNLSKIDFVSDNCVYVRGNEGVVVDIDVQLNEYELKHLYDYMNPQVFKYLNANISYYKELLDEEDRIRKDFYSKYKTYTPTFKPDLQNLLIRARASSPGDHIPKNNRGKSSLKRTYKKHLLDTFRIEFTIKYEITPDISAKYTDMHG